MKNNDSFFVDMATYDFIKSASNHAADKYNKRIAEMKNLEKSDPEEATRKKKLGRILLGLCAAFFALWLYLALHFA